MPLKSQRATRRFIITAGERRRHAGSLTLWVAAPVRPPPAKIRKELGWGMYLQSVGPILRRHRPLVGGRSSSHCSMRANTLAYRSTVVHLGRAALLNASHAQGSDGRFSRRANARCRTPVRRARRLRGQPRPCSAAAPYWRAALYECEHGGTSLFLFVRTLAPGKSNPSLRPSPTSLQQSRVAVGAWLQSSFMRPLCLQLCELAG